MALPQTPPVIGAIDVGTNAARLKLAHLYPGGRSVPFYKQRAPIRPGEGVFTTGEMPPPVVERLVATMRQFMDICLAHGARVRAVATSSLRNARNAEAVQARILAEAGVRLEVISGLEEARLICLGVLHGRRAAERSLVVDVGGGSTEVILAAGETPIGLWSLPIGTVRLTDLYGSARRMQPRRLARLRAATRGVVEDGLRILPGEGLPSSAYGSSGSIKALAGYVGPRSSNRIECARLSDMAEELAAMKMRRRRQLFPPGRADIIVAGVVILEALAAHLGLQTIDAVQAGLRDGLLVSLERDRTARAAPPAPDVLPESA
jgi:exopolyphosphatase/guanosine-5'-triphosphate,3'-diphosphate pyrophosphatase